VFQAPLRPTGDYCDEYAFLLAFVLVSTEFVELSLFQRKLPDAPGLRNRMSVKYSAFQVLHYASCAYEYLSVLCGLRVRRALSRQGVAVDLKR
jgi:hypothetical protein